MVAEGHDFQAQSIDGNHTSSGYRTMSSPMSIDTRTLRDFDDAKWLALIDQAIVQPLLTQQMQLFIDTLNDMTATTGNVIDAKGQPFSEALLLKVLDAGLLTFEDDGSPVFPSMLVNRAVFEKVKSMEPSNEFKAQQATIVERNRLAWRLEQSDRKLVD